MFLLFINDLPNVVSPGTTVRLFADDLLLYRPIRDQNDRRHLQEDLTAVYEWGQTWGMRFNATKCETLIVTRDKQVPAWFYNLGGEPITPVSQATYLGLKISHNLSWSEHIANLKVKASQRLGFIKRNLKGSSHRQRKTAYISLVRSTMGYCGSLWDPVLKKEINMLESIQNRAVRWITRTYSRDSNLADLKEELGLPTLEEMRRQQRLSLIFKVLNSELNVPPAEVDLLPSGRTGRACQGGGSQRLRELGGKDSASPLWRSTTARGVKEWNSLPATILSAETAGIFSSRLAKAGPP